MPKPTELVLADQFDRKADLADVRGQVVIAGGRGDRKATDACRNLGESLRVHSTPAAKGQAPREAQAAPVVPLANLKPGQASPNVCVVPVACCGKVPGPIRGAIRNQIAKASPDAVVWLDFTETLKAAFGQTAGQPNVLVFDAAGRLRMKFSGVPDQTGMENLVKAVQGLRVEAAGN
ncbi:MAG: hypothetical protein U0792_17565 [Gemmataceae bacterium]